MYGGKIYSNRLYHTDPRIGMAKQSSAGLNMVLQIADSARSEQSREKQIVVDVSPSTSHVTPNENTPMLFHHGNDTWIACNDQISSNENKLKQTLYTPIGTSQVFNATWSLAGGGRDGKSNPAADSLSLRPLRKNLTESHDHTLAEIRDVPLVIIEGGGRVYERLLDEDDQKNPLKLQKSKRDILATETNSSFKRQSWSGKPGDFPQHSNKPFNDARKLPLSCKNQLQLHYCWDMIPQSLHTRRLGEL